MWLSLSRGSNSPVFPYMLNINRNKMHPCLAPLFIAISSVILLSSLRLTVFLQYRFAMNRTSLLSIPMLLRIFIMSLWRILLNAFSKSIKHRKTLHSCLCIVVLGSVKSNNAEKSFPCSQAFPKSELCVTDVLLSFMSDAFMDHPKKYLQHMAHQADGSMFAAFLGI